MCFNVIEYQLGVAEKDIEAFKVVYCTDTPGLFSSTYYDYPYEVGKEYESKVNYDYDKEDCTYNVHDGLHSYKEGMVQCINVGNMVLYICNKEDITPLDNFFVFSKQLAVLHCVIPKGANYLQNDKGELVSDKLRVVGAEMVTDNFLTNEYP